MAISYHRLKNNYYVVYCLSSDEKPTASVGGLLIEIDTFKLFYVVADEWVEKA